VLWKHKAQLRHASAQAWCLFNQNDPQTRIGKVQGGPHTGDATPDYQR
jgi:hypothetical protein